MTMEEMKDKIEFQRQMIEIQKQLIEQLTEQNEILKQKLSNQLIPEIRANYRR